MFAIPVTECRFICKTVSQAQITKVPKVFLPCLIMALMSLTSATLLRLLSLPLSHTTPPTCPVPPAGGCLWDVGHIPFNPLIRAASSSWMFSPCRIHSAISILLTFHISAQVLPSQGRLSWLSGLKSLVLSLPSGDAHTDFVRHVCVSYSMGSSTRAKAGSNFAHGSNPGYLAQSRNTVFVKGWTKEGTLEEEVVETS